MWKSRHSRFFLTSILVDPLIKFREQFVQGGRGSRGPRFGDYFGDKLLPECTTAAA